MTTLFEVIWVNASILVVALGAFFAGVAYERQRNKKKEVRS